MTTFTEFLSQRLETGGFTTEDALASFLPLLRQVAAAHRTGLVAPLQGINHIQVDNTRLWFEEKQLAKPAAHADQIKALETAPCQRGRRRRSISHASRGRARRRQLRQPANRQTRRAADPAVVPARLCELGTRSSAITIR